MSMLCVSSSWSRDLAATPGWCLFTRPGTCCTTTTTSSSWPSSTSRARYRDKPDPDRLLGEEFTLRELRLCHEAVAGKVSSARQLPAYDGAASRCQRVHHRRRSRAPSGVVPARACRRGSAAACGHARSEFEAYLSNDCADVDAYCGLCVRPSTYTGLASRDTIAKLRLDGAPTPRSWVARMTKRPSTDRCWQERLRRRGPE